MRACTCVSVCFEHENTRNLDNHSMMTKMVGVGHELCQLALLQIHTIEPQLNSHCCSVIFLSLFFPHCFSHSSYSIPCPFTPSPEKYPCIFYKQMTSEHNSTVAEAIPSKLPNPHLAFGTLFSCESIFLLVTLILFLTLQIELPYSFLQSSSPS